MDPSGLTLALSLFLALSFFRFLSSPLSLSLLRPATRSATPTPSASIAVTSHLGRDVGTPGLSSTVVSLGQRVMLAMRGGMLVLRGNLFVSVSIICRASLTHI